MAMVRRGLSGEKYRGLVGREFHRRREELPKERSENRLEVMDGWDETEAVRGSNFTSGLMVISLRMQVCWFRFMEDIVNNGVDFELHVLLDIKPIKRFECRSDL